jgi:hypothetical protein
MRNARPSALAAAAVVLAGVLAGSPPASAKDAASSPIARYAESLDVTAGIEHRLLIVHPILARAPAAKVREPLRLGGTAPPDLVAIGVAEKNAKHVDVVGFAPEPLVFLTGDVIRTATADYAVAKDRVFPGAEPAKVAVTRISREVDVDGTVSESLTLGQVLPSAIRYVALTETQGAEIREVAERFAVDAGLATPRRSPAELATAERIKKRAADYRTALLTLPKADADRAIVGCAFLLDGALASFETFGSGALFRDAWPKLLEAASVEAAVAEVKANLLDTDLADPADPDRFLSDLKRRMLGVFGARAKASDVLDAGKEFALALENAAARALVLEEDRVVHFIWVTDPTHRGDKPPGEGIDIRAAERKARPTEEEQRHIDRRNGGSAAPKPPSPVEPPPAPK